MIQSSLTQQRLWFLNQLEDVSGTWSVPVAARLRAGSWIGRPGSWIGRRWVQPCWTRWYGKGGCRRFSSIRAAFHGSES